MTNFRIDRHRFSRAEVKAWGNGDERYTNWPVVYTLDDDTNVYVGESLNVAARMRQHLDSPQKQHLRAVRVVIDDTFNKSVCLDLESYLIRLLAGDGKYRVLNRNDGITDADYYSRGQYQDTFDAIFRELRGEGMFTRTVAQIENSDLFKLSPFKALSHDQAIAVEDILEGLFDDLHSGAPSTIVIQGSPGTGKTVVAIYLMKLLRDISTTPPGEALDSDSIFSEFFVEENRALLNEFRVGLVIPQQSLRTSVQKVFRKTPGLSADMVLTPFEVGQSEPRFDLLIVDETHRLNQRANQASAALNQKFAEINARLFGADDTSKTQLDWIRTQSNHQIFLLDSAQSVRPADLPTPTQERLVADAVKRRRHYLLSSQMRVRAGVDYIGYIRQILSSKPPARQEFIDYDFRMFDRLSQMRDEIRRRDAETGLARLVAGYAWPWKSKKDPSAYDIEIEECRFRWNRATRDWINSPGSLDEVGSIHTVQGYDLNYAGVIIGPELRYDPRLCRLLVDRANYRDTKGKENNRSLGITYTDDDLLRFITNIYGVLLTRGIRGTYIYVCDPELRSYLRQLVRN
ncbi:MAG TPA: DNA/RNA helicase domain-containing protein [Microbacteriaceae bacterium]